MRVPQFLRERDQWIVWWYRDASRKVPLSTVAIRQYVDAHETGSKNIPRHLLGSANDASSATNYEEARELAQYLRDTRKMQTGIGYALTNDKQIIVFDFDDVLDKQQRINDKRVDAVLRDLSTYVEVSPSGRGLHAYCAVTPALKQRIAQRVGAWCSFTSSREGGAQHSVFVGAGYVTVTGNAYKARTQAFNEEADEYVRKWFALRFTAERTHEQSSSDVELEDGGVEAQVLDALEKIDADCDRDTWVRVGMVLHKLTHGEDKGRELWDAWSRRAPHRYPKSNAPSIERLYRSFDANSTRAVSLGTLLHMAREYGTDRDALKHARERLQRTISDAKTSLEKLALQRGVQQQEVRAGPDGLEVVALSDIESEATRWLWTGLVPFGHLLLLSGGVGAGKSTFLLKLASDVTHARVLPYDSQHKQHQQRIEAALGKGSPLARPYKRSGRVYYLTSEMHWAQTAAPTLRACNAVADNVLFVRRTTKTDKKGNVVTRPFDLATDLDKLIRDIVRRAVIPDLIVLDPITSFMGTTVDKNVEGDVRTILEMMGDFCASIGTAFVGVLHQNKSLDHAGVGKMLGSVAFGAVARVVLFVWPCASLDKGKETDETTRWEQEEKWFGVVVEKSNIAATNVAHVFAIGASESGLGVRVEHKDEQSTSEFFRALRDAQNSAKQSSKGDISKQVTDYVARECDGQQFKSLNALHVKVAEGVGCSIAYARLVIERSFALKQQDGMIRVERKMQ